MKAVKFVLAGGVAAAALATAAPAAAQYYPNPYGYGGTGNVIGQVINQVLGGGYNSYGNYGYGVNSQAAVGQCVNAVQARLGGNYGYNAYNYGGGRVLGISRVEPRSNGGLTIRGVANSGRTAAYGYNSNAQVDLTFRCRADYRGYITDVDIDRAQGSYGYNSYTPYSQYDYSRYGYRRY